MPLPGSPGSQFLIHGIGFGVNNTVSTDDVQWLGDYIENGTVGESIDTEIPGWKDAYPIAKDDSASSVYDNTSAHSGDKSISIFFHYGSEESSPIRRYKGYFSWDSGKDLNKVYVSYWVRFEWPGIVEWPGSWWSIQHY